MSYDLAIWKSSVPVTAELAQVVYESICENQPHATMKRFDLNRLEAAIAERFGAVRDDADDPGDAPFLYKVNDYKDCPANWMSLEMGHDEGPGFLPDVVAIASQQELIVYDPQEEQVWQ